MSRHHRRSHVVAERVPPANQLRRLGAPEWFPSLDGQAAELVTAASTCSHAEGPTLTRPVVDRVRGSSQHNMGGRLRVVAEFDDQSIALL
jgi:hypothetical protein